MGGLIDKHLSWKMHINVIKNIVSKNLGLLYRARRVLDCTALKKLYFSFIHSYLNYGNVVWASTSTTKLKKLTSKQKQAFRIVNNEFTDISQIMVKMKVLNIYKLNIYQILNVMFKLKINTAPCIFENQFTEIQHQYPTRFSRNKQYVLQLSSAITCLYPFSHQNTHFLQVPMRFST